MVVWRGFPLRAVPWCLPLPGVPFCRGARLSRPSRQKRGAAALLPWRAWLRSRRRIAMWRLLALAVRLTCRMVCGLRRCRLFRAVRL